MADTQIWAPDVAAGESVYEVRGGVEFTLKAVNADFDGSGAAAVYLPCVLIVSDSGHVIARACDQAVTVGAGDDAEVSWFPGVKHSAAAVATSLDMFSPHQDADLFAFDINGVWINHWNTAATVDTACLHNGYLASDGTAGAYIGFRFSLGPHGSFWIFDVLYTAGPTGGELWCYMASIPEDDPNYGATDNTGVLQDISTLNFMLAWKLNMNAVGLTRNQIANPGFKGPIQNPFATTLFRIGGQPGDPLTSSVIESPPGLYAKINGGPGMYAVKLVSNTGVSRLQSLAVSRCDWAFA